MPSTFNLHQLRVASPCSANWGDMRGDARVRHCDECNLNVYNFAALSEEEVASLVLKTEGRLCGRLHRRADGTILLRDCPVGLREAARRTWRFAARAAIACALLIVTVVAAAWGRSRDPVAQTFAESPPISTLRRWLEDWAPRRMVIMGAIAAPPPPLASGPTSPPVNTGE